MNALFYYLIVCFIFGYISCMEKVEEACKKEAFGTTRKTKIDPHLKLRLEQIKKSNPTMYADMMRVAKTMETNNARIGLSGQEKKT